MIKALQKKQRFITFLCFLGIYILLQYAFLSSKVTPDRVFINFLLILPLFGLLLFLTRRNYLAFMFLTAFLYCVYFIDSIVYAGRLTHLRYSDIFAVDDALRVASKYSISFTPQNALLLGIIIFVNVTVIIVSINYSEKQDKKETAIIGLITFIISLVLVITGTQYGFISDPMKSIDDNFDVNSIVDREGLYYTLYGQYCHSILEAPNGYDKGKAEKILAKYKSQTKAVEPTRIIVIMNEALADYTLVGEPVFADPLINIHNPDNHYYEGKLAVSVFGGYTCNTEFEFLTGCSMRFLPKDYIPFSQLVVSDFPSIAWDMKEHGISSDGIHPYYSQEWNRRQVYKYLGFDHFIAGEDFSSGLASNSEIHNITDIQLKELDFGSDLEYIRGFISDAEAYRKAYTVLNNREGFLFIVTVQNHGGFEYSKADFTNKEYISGEYALNQYLTCTEISDDAFKHFTDQLSEDDIKTIVLMFGDHQPGLDFSSYVNGFSSDPFSCYYVPYIVWSNYELEYELPQVTSANYLSAIIKQCAGMSLTEWDYFRLDVMKKYPIITGNFVMDNDMRVSLGNDNNNDLLKDYALVQYSILKR